MNENSENPQAQGGNPDLAKRMRLEIKDIGIPPRPAILDKIEREMERDEPDFRYLADLIGQDVALSAALIKTTNSPYFGFSKKVGSVGEALLVLGLKVIVRTVAGLALRQTFPSIPSLERFWDASATCARVSGWLATELGRPHGVRADDAYTFGLFRDSGIPVLMIPFPEYPSVLKTANNEAIRQFTDIEDEQIFLNHAAVGAELAKNWLLPEEVHEAIRLHHTVAGLTDTPRRCAALIAIAQTAEHLVQQTTSLSQTREWEKLGAASMATLDIGEREIELLAKSARAIAGGAD